MTASRVAGGQGQGQVQGQGQGQMMQGRGRGGRMVQGRGRMVQGRGGRTVPARGQGGRMIQGRGGRMMQPLPQPPQCILKSLQDHILLNIFNMLDNKGRINGFRAIGWSTKRYVMRRDNLRKQMENQERMEKERSERTEWRNGIFTNVLNAGVKNNKLSEGEIGGGWDEQRDEQETNGEEKKEADAMKKSDSKEPQTKEMSKVKFSDNVKEGKPEVKEPLPYLGTRVDPMTLLCRLNTRRLYNRLKYYKQEEKKQKEEEEKMKAALRAKGHTILEPSIIEMYDRDLKEKLLMDRIYPKNLTVMQMAQKEWNELLEMANYKNQSGHALPFDPIPTKHELLLFQQCPRAVAVLASYPRSGNSLMRTLYEHTTLRVTGSDMQGGLAKHDLVGEMAVGSGMVQFVKTHYPERMGSTAFPCSRAVLLVRNPFDCIESYFHLMMTGKHTASLPEATRNKAETYFDEYAVKEAAVWTKFHEYWLEQDIPILLVRYEDLYRQTDKVMESVLQFVLEVKRMGTFFTERVDRCIREEQKIEALGSYKPRSAGIGKSLKKYKPQVIERMKTPEMLAVMKKLGYSFMLENPVEKWSEMPPLSGYATEIMSAKAFVNEKNTVILNNNGNIISRTQELNTPFQLIKRNLGILDDDCDCQECTKRKQLVGAAPSGKKDGEEGDADVSSVNANAVGETANGTDTASGETSPAPLTVF